MCDSGKKNDFEVRHASTEIPAFLLAYCVELKLNNGSEAQSPNL